MGRDADNAGAAYVSQWLRTELLHLLKHSHVLSPADRAVVIIGQGHEVFASRVRAIESEFARRDPL